MNLLYFKWYKKLNNIYKARRRTMKVAAIGDNCIDVYERIGKK